MTKGACNARMGLAPVSWCFSSLFLFSVQRLLVPPEATGVTSSTLCKSPKKSRTAGFSRLPFRMAPRKLGAHELIHQTCPPWCYSWLEISVKSQYFGKFGRFNYPTAQQMSHLDRPSGAAAAMQCFPLQGVACHQEVTQSPTANSLEHHFQYKSSFRKPIYTYQLSEACLDSLRNEDDFSPLPRGKVVSHPGVLTLASSQLAAVHGNANIEWTNKSPPKSMGVFLWLFNLFRHFKLTIWFPQGLPGFFNDMHACTAPALVVQEDQLHPFPLQLQRVPSGSQTGWEVKKALLKESKDESAKMQMQITTKSCIKFPILKDEWKWCWFVLTSSPTSNYGPNANFRNSEDLEKDTWDLVSRKKMFHWSTQIRGSTHSTFGGRVTLNHLLQVDCSMTNMKVQTIPLQAKCTMFGTPNILGTRHLGVPFQQADCHLARNSKFLTQH